MEIYAGIQREDKKLVNLFRNTEVPARLMLGGTIFKIGEMPGLGVQKYEYDIPDILLKERDLRFFILCTDGRADSSCWFFYGSNRKRLSPLTTSAKGNTYFLQEKAYQVVFFEESNTFSLAILVLERRGNKVVFQEKPIWEGGCTKEPIPKSYSSLEQMIKSAFDLYEKRVKLLPTLSIVIGGSNNETAVK
jgi:hypothetical protein